MQSLVVVPPDVLVDVAAWPLAARVGVAVDQFLPDGPVGGFDHGVVVRASLRG